MKLFQLLAMLLDYPHDDARAELTQLVHEYEGVGGLLIALDPDRLFSGQEREQIARCLEWLLAQPTLAAQADYVKTFDLVPEHSLHLTHHVFGDDKNRGPALIDLSEIYKSYGLQHDEHEIPDFLPLMLEFVSQLEPDEARLFLSDAVRILASLADRLAQAESPYAPLLQVIANHATLTRKAA